MSASAQARFIAEGIENVIRNESVEIGVLLDCNGAEIARHPGSASEVGFAPGDLIRAAGGIFTHNHPAGTGPSVQDVKVSAAYGLAELRVVTSRHRYVVTSLLNIDLNRLQAEYNAELGRVDTLLRDEVRCNKLHPRDFSSELVHRTWERVRITLRFGYRREQS